MKKLIKKKAFTLVELLMVIGIISIMMILLIPSLHPIKTEVKNVSTAKNKEIFENLVEAKASRLSARGLEGDDLLNEVVKELLEEPSVNDITNPFDSSKKGVGLILGNTYDDTNKAAYLFSEEPIVESLPRGTVYFRINQEELVLGDVDINGGTTGGTGNPVTPTPPVQSQASQFNIASFSANTVIQKNGNTYVFGSNYYRRITTTVVEYISNPTLLTISGTVKPKHTLMGIEHSLAIGDDGNLYAWGYNYYGQLGDGTTTDKNSPTLINMPNGAKPNSISIGYNHSMAIGTDGNLYTWGNNGYGQLGTGDLVNRKTPTLITLATGVKPVSISAGCSQSLAIGDDGNLYAWGYNAYSQLGNGNTADQSKPVLVKFPTGIKATYITSGQNHSLAIGSDGNLYAWGGNQYDQLGTGDTANKTTPTLVTLPNKVKPKLISAGYHYTMVVGTDNNIYGWGRNESGQLGTGDITNVKNPQIIYLPNKIKATDVATGQYHTLATGVDGNVYIWGLNSSGQLGTGDSLPRLSPTLSKVLTNLE